MRAFNRFYTGAIGVLGDGVQRTPYSLTEARLIFELAQAAQTETVELRRRLDLDPGYLSRLLVRFEADGLVTLDRSTTDGRRQVVQLTDAGRRVFATLDTQVMADMRGLITPLADHEQRQLLDAMSTIQRLLGQPTSPEPPPAVTLRPPAAGDLGWVVQRHGEVYREEYDWPHEFEAMVARIVADYVDLYDPARDAAWIAEVDGSPAGCIFCVHKDDSTAQLRLLFVEPSARGMGIGAKLIDECLRFARDAGYRDIILFTNSALHGARRLYQRAGFELTSEEPSHRFGGDQVFEYWRRSLR
jgi:DNA-binding MarR family transcriptional regulator/GNAT superfamily N-acetyltransferase